MTCPIRRHIRQPVRRSGLRESTNLSLSEDGREEKPYAVSGAQRPNNQQRAHSVEGTRLNEHDEDHLVRSIDSSHPQGSASVPDV